MEKEPLGREISPEKPDIFIRHGKRENPLNYSYAEFQRFLANPDDFPLNEEGIEEIKKSAEEIPDPESIDLILCSSYRRTKDTATIIQEKLEELVHKEVPIRITDSVREVEINPDVLSEAEYKELLMQGGEEAIADAIFKKWQEGKAGETPEELEKRVHSFLRLVHRIHTSTRYNRVIIVSHASFGRALKRVIEGTPVDAPRDKVLGTGKSFYVLRDPSKEVSNLSEVQKEYIVFSPEMVSEEYGDGN